MMTFLVKEDIKEEEDEGCNNLCTIFYYTQDLLVYTDTVSQSFIFFY